jgi:hypothetical protein
MRRGADARWLLILVFIATLPVVTPRIYASDEALYFAYLRSLWFDHDLDFDNEYRHFYETGMVRTPLFRDTFLASATATGRRINFATVGCAILWSPFYAVADAGVRAARAAGAPIEADGYSRPYLWAVGVGSAAYGFLALLLSTAVARRIVPAFAGATSMRQAIPATAVWLGTPLVFYMYVAPPYAHACSAFTVAAFTLTWLRVRPRWTPRGMAALGAMAALMTMVREQDAFYVAGPAVDFAWTLIACGRATDRAARAATPPASRLLLAASAGVLAFAVAFAPQALVYLTLNGRVGPSPLLSRKITVTSPHAFQVLFSPSHGFLFWTPMAVAAFAGVALLAWRPHDRHDGPLAPRPAIAPLATAGETRRLAICLLVMAASCVYITGSVESWTVAGAFGQRRFIGLTVVLVTGIAVLVTRATRAGERRLLAGALAVSVWWNLALMAQFGVGLMDRQRLEPARNAWNAFVVVPRELPGLLYRYVFDRASFYRPTPDR